MRFFFVYTLQLERVSRKGFHVCYHLREGVGRGQGTMASVGAEPQEFRTPPRGHWYLGDLKGSTAVLSDCSWEPQHPKSETQWPDLAQGTFVFGVVILPVPVALHQMTGCSWLAWPGVPAAGWRAVPVPSV